MKKERGIIAWMAHNPVAANLLMLLTMLLGIYAAIDIRKEVFPSFPADIMTVVVPYPGGSPEEVEESIVIKIEEAIQDLAGIKEIYSEASETSGTVTIQIDPGVDITDMLNKVTVRVNSISAFPANAEKPIVNEQLRRREVIKLAIYGATSEAQLKQLANEVRDDLLQQPGITQVETSGTRNYEISIEIADQTLREYGLSFDQVVAAVRNRSINLPGGNLRTSTGTISLRSDSQAYRHDEFVDLAIITRADGTRIRLGEIATIRDTFNEQPVLSRFNGKPSVALSVHSIGKQDALKISRQVKEYLVEKRQILPQGLFIDSWSDRSEILRSRIELLGRNALQGGFLVLLTLALFLRPNIAFWVAVGVPFSFLGALFVMSLPVVDVSINVLSLFGFILVLGIVVDDAIVTAESAYALLEEENDGIHSIIRGVKRVATATIFGVITTVIAFFPMLLIETGMGRFFAVLSPVVILCLIFSLIETKLVLPAHLRHISINGQQQARPSNHPLWKLWPFSWIYHSKEWVLVATDRVQTRVSGGMKNFITNVYRPTLNAAINHRYLTLSLFLCLIIFSSALVPSGWVRFVFFPSVPSNSIRVTLVMPVGTPYQITHNYALQIEAAAARVNKEYQKNSDIDQDQIQFISTLSENDISARFRAELLPSTNRTVSSIEIADRWRQQIGELAGVKELSFNALAAHTGAAIDIQLQGSDLNQLRLATDELKSALRQFDGVFDISDTFGSGGPQLDISVTTAGEALGLGDAELARQIRQAFFGAEVQRIQRGRDEVKVYVRLPRQDRASIESLSNLWIDLPNGNKVPFPVVGQIKQSTGISRIHRMNRQRIVNVKADVDKTQVEPDKVVSELVKQALPPILAKYSSVSFVLEGDIKDQAENSETLKLGSVIVLLAIYAALAIPLRSYGQPLIIMAAIPFGIVGALLGHFITGHSVSILSIIGMVALAGIVVNDSLVLVDHINQRVRSGMEKMAAVVASGERRFRAVILTSITTFTGLMPLLLETSVQAQFLIPMAISVAFGVLFATTVTLILIPVLFFVIRDVKQLFAEASGSSTHQA